MAKIDAFFQLMHDQGASDLHLVSGQQPVLRIRGEMERIKFNVLNNDELKAMLYEIAPEHKVKQFEETGDVDFAYEIPNLARYRANFFTQKFGVAAVFREIPSKIMTCQELGLPSGAYETGLAAERTCPGNRSDRMRKINDPCRHH